MFWLLLTFRPLRFHAHPGAASASYPHSCAVSSLRIGSIFPLPHLALIFKTVCVLVKILLTNKITQILNNDLSQLEVSLLTSSGVYRWVVQSRDDCPYVIRDPGAFMHSSILSIFLSTCGPWGQTFFSIMPTFQERRKGRRMGNL